MELQLQQGSPQQVARLLLDGEADIGIATEALALHPELLALPCYRWTHSVVLPPGHALSQGPLTLERLSIHPIVTYETGYTGRAHIDEAFQAAGLPLKVVLAAMDADVIKTYVELGLGVGIVASIAYDEERDAHLFADNMTRLAVRRDSYLRDYAYSFIETFASPLDRPAVDAARNEG